jgi:hypothetical protein
MNPSLRAQLRDLDRALLALLDERARLLSDVEAGDPGRAAAIEDMQRRHDGPFSAAGIVSVFRAIDAHCAGFARADDPRIRSDARSIPEARDGDSREDAQ